MLIQKTENSKADVEATKRDSWSYQPVNIMADAKLLRYKKRSQNSRRNVQGASKFRVFQGEKMAGSGATSFTNY